MLGHTCTQKKVERPYAHKSCIDKETLKKNKEPLKTLNTYRKQQGGAMFGMNVIPLGEGEIKVGMNVEIISSSRKSIGTM